jgi:hypothetical protein
MFLSDSATTEKNPNNLSEAKSCHSVEPLTAAQVLFAELGPHLAMILTGELGWVSSSRILVLPAILLSANWGDKCAHRKIVRITQVGLDQRESHTFMDIMDWRFYMYRFSSLK